MQPQLYLSLQVEKMIEIPWERFKQMELAEKSPQLSQKNGRPFHTIFAQQFDRALLDDLGGLATTIRTIAKKPEGNHFLQSLLSHKRAMLFFTQPSTRTFLSFVSACQILGLRLGEVRDTSISSEFKGESREDSVRTFSSYFDAIIMRTQAQGLAERMAWVLLNSDRPVPIINAGSGKDQHPTQALLDVYTLQRSFEAHGGIDGKRVVFVGDLLRGRTVRSLSFLLTNYSDVEQVFVAPPALQVAPDILDILDARGVKYKLMPTLISAVPDADAIYMTRIQDEWDTVSGESSEIDLSDFCFGLEELAVMKKHAVLMHPLPRRQEISTAVDSDPRAVYWRQMRNGMWVRAALIASTFEREEAIRDYGDGE